MSETTQSEFRKISKVALLFVGVFSGMLCWFLGYGTGSKRGYLKGYNEGVSAGIIASVKPQGETQGNGKECCAIEIDNAHVSPAGIGKPQAPAPEVLNKFHLTWPGQDAPLTISAKDRLDVLLRIPSDRMVPWTGLTIWNESEWKQCGDICANWDYAAHAPAAAHPLKLGKPSAKWHRTTHQECESETQREYKSMEGWATGDPAITLGDGTFDAGTQELWSKQPCGWSDNANPPNIRPRYVYSKKGIEREITEQEFNKKELVPQ